MISIPSPNHWAGRFGASPHWIIIHGTAGFETAQEVGVYFGSTASQVSAHYIVDRDGTVVQCVLESDAAWANGGISGEPGVSGDGVHHDPWWDASPTWMGRPNPNLTTISIEHVKPSTDNSDQLTDAQKAASFALIKAICERNGIPKRQADASGGITGHFSMDPINKSRCPGPYPWSDLWNYLSQGDNTDMLQITDPFAAAHFVKVSETLWNCTTPGHKFGVHDGVLTYYRTIQGAPRLPMGPEVYGVIHDHPECSVQLFESAAIIYDPKNSYDNPGFGACYQVKLTQDSPILRQYASMAGIALPAKLTTEAAPPAQSTPDPAKIDAAVSTLEAVQAGVANALLDLKAS
jgi:N-acetyl-anhydromuramyl-L-alanine amidase AmpD